MQTKPFTKSRFKLAHECANKIYYANNKDLFENLTLDDDFLKALAQGGYQVGALAKEQYKAQSAEVFEFDYFKSIQQTNELLANPSINIIFEGAFQFENLFVRVDVLRKNTFGGYDLIEVKAKSYDDTVQFFDKKNNIKSEWDAYLMDVAFQKYVIEKSTRKQVKPYLLLADKTKQSTVDGLNQKFRIKGNEKSVSIIVDENISIGEPILREVSIDDEISSIENKTYNLSTKVLENNELNSTELNFEAYIQKLNYIYLNNIKQALLQIESPKDCKKCEFKSDDFSKSGFHQCWMNYYHFSENELKTNPLIFDVWNLRTPEYLADKQFFIKDLTLNEPKSDKQTRFGMSRYERQLTQVTKLINNDASFYLDIENLKADISSFNYPLHFIDFETSTVALPFYKGMRPYETVAFQFSHHILYENEKIEHYSEWINVEPGKFPNFEFVRALKKSLENDNGTIFRYSIHENTVLNHIKTQLLASQEPDKQSLMDFIETITVSKSDVKHTKEGNRVMVDLCEVVKAYYYEPVMKGSNSIKAVLPAVLHSSSFLREKYSQSIYGTDVIKSINFNNHTWLKFDEKGAVINPYKTLPKIFENTNDDLLDDFISDMEEVKNGGHALYAYAKMQYTNMSIQERELLKNSLLKYCELDTMAMVMIYEFFLSEIKKTIKN
jgi:hypothetical protein